MNATPVSATVFAAGLVIVNVSVLVPLSGMLVGLNALAIDGGATTVTVAEAVLPLPPSLEPSAPVTDGVAAALAPQQRGKARGCQCGRERSGARAPSGGHPAPARGQARRRLALAFVRLPHPPRL